MSRLILCALSTLFLHPVAGFGQRPESGSGPDALLTRTQQWVDTWNAKDVDSMRRLHADDVVNQRYGIGQDFITMDWLLRELKEKNFWDVSWSIRMVEPKVRMLGSEAGVVSFRLVGSETPAGAATRPFAEIFTLVFQRIKGEWLIVHVHDSTRPDPEP